KHGSPAWLEFRKKGIGGSDAAAILGVSPYKTNVQVWEEKTGRRTPDDISDKPNVQYGKAAEELLIKLFALDYPQYKVKINHNVVYKRGFMFASLDAELIEIATGDRGLYEGKTTEVHSGNTMKMWDRQIPEYYYVQVLHYLITTGWKFAVCKGQIKQTGKNNEIELITRHYPYARADLLDDLKYLYLKEKEFWERYVLTDKRPPLILPKLIKN
ncbi:MAG: YqaJ viral recombinase family protein, partial [Muribaculaceae bacterium]|nr:YqaJ viral recombinase family protein [Muribaculaceae bacterium]